MFNLFYLKNSAGKRKLMRASMIYRNVMEAGIKNDFEILLNAKSLINVCTHESFPKKYAPDIQATLLDYYGMLLYCNDNILRDNKSNLKAVCNLYNKLNDSKNINVKESRKTFLNSYLEYITNLGCPNGLKFNSSFIRVSCAWREKQFKKLIKKENVDFYALKSSLYKSFSSLINLLMDAKIIVSQPNKDVHIKNCILDAKEKNLKKKKLLFK